MNTDYIQGLVQNNVTFLLKSLLNLSDEDILLDNTLAGALGCDNLDAVEIIMSLEYTLNITIDDEFWTNPEEDTLKPSLTIQDLMEYCARKVYIALKDIP